MTLTDITAMAASNSFSPEKEKKSGAPYLKLLDQYMPVAPAEFDAMNADVAHLAKARKCRDEMLKSLKANFGVSDNPKHSLGAASTGNSKEFKLFAASEFEKQAKTYLTSKLCLQAAMLEANGRRRVRDRLSPHALIKASHAFGVLKNLGETVTVHHIRKSNGKGYRRIEDFGPVARGAQLLAVDLLELIYNRRPFQCGNLGSGQKVEMALDLIRNHGFCWLAEYDIAKFYETIDLEKLAKALPLPKEAVAQIVGAISAQRVYPTGTKAYPLSPKARPGIPQGSSASNEVAAWSVAHLPMPDLEDVVLINHVDNFYLLAKDFKSLDAASKTLGAAISGCPGGPFTAELRQFLNVDKHIFEMLGCCIYRDKKELVAFPCDTALTKYRRRLKREHGNALGQLNIAQASGNAAHRFDGVLDFVHLEAYLKAWLAAFKCCDDVYMKPVRDSGIDYVESLRFKFGIADEEVKTARRYVSPISIDLDS